MKFASYLDNAQAPEWKRAYIDYRGLKKRVTAIKQDKECSTGKYVNAPLEGVPDASSDRAGSSTGLVDRGHEADDDTSTQYEMQKRQSVVDTRDDQIEDLNTKAGGASKLEVTTSGLASLDSATRTPTVYGHDTVSPMVPERQPSPLSLHHPRGPRPREGRNADRSSRLEATTSGLTSFDMHSSTRTPMVNGQDTVSPVAPEIQPSPLLPRRPRGPRPQELRKRLTGRFPKAPSLAPSTRSRLLTLSVTGLFLKAPSLAPSTRPRPLTFSEILEHMSPVELEFFDKLNLELSKVDHFFIEREAEARVRSLELREQLEELKNHQRSSPRGSSSYVYYGFSCVC
ncbi:SPX domain-containing protein [Lactifluus volemus]|nr:SPX domain-containing protein [Lactifluus volemus]